ncbi:MAG: Unknown protein [uncultured Sulfurovum sp.]|uniref:Uncharacterized protein n=1 Tax=uncultured Sulfurovum sp. TaxID=269237 RepID=A0A6S6U449_9BACT|nr:MAG: Unknown protein [uncultured Sulfurovum sp.]
MKISVDISLYPLKEVYKEPIHAFIAALDAEEGVEVEPNRMSTHIHGEYSIIMKLLEREIYSVFKEIPDSAFVIKLIGHDREGAYAK